MKLFWEGLNKDRSWSEVQLLQAQQQYAQYDCLADLKPLFEGERAFGNGIFRYIQSQRREPSFVFDIGLGDDSSESVVLGRFLRACPRGWIYLEQLNFNRNFDKFILPDQSNAGPRCDLQQQKDNQNGLSESTHVSGYAILWRHQVMSALLLPGLINVHQHCAQKQAQVEMTVMAAALERYHCAQDAYPPQLKSLVPEYMDALPNDVVALQPYRYSVSTDDGFILYSIGWNGTDDQGVESDTRHKGDWVWSRMPR